MAHVDRSPPALGEQQGEVVLAMDNVRLELPIAGVGSRVLAASLDYLLLGILMFFWFVGGMATLGVLEVSPGWGMASLLFGMFLLKWGYFAAFEIATRGKTPGKLALGIRVVGRHGGRAGAAAIVVRNLLRTVDMLVGVPMLLADSRARRLGDLVGGTLVIHERAERGEEFRLARVPAGCGAREVEVLESFLLRAPHMEPARARELGGKLLRWLETQDPVLAAERDAGVDAVESLRRLLLAP